LSPATDPIRRLRGLATLLAAAFVVSGTEPLAAQVAQLDGRALGPELLAHTLAVATDPTDDFVPGFADWFARSLDRELEEAVAEGVTPGAALVVGHRGRIALVRGYGRLDWAADAPPVTAATVYDLASVTKVAATTVATMLLVEEGRLALDAPVARYLDAWPREGERSRITVRQLLDHSSGLPAGAPFWRAGDEPSEWIDAIAEVPLEHAPGERQLYSDLGPVLAGFVVQAVAGEGLDRFLARRVFGPLGMERTTFRPLERGVPAEVIAPTEVLEDGHLRGIVHDPAARALGGVAGNAGLFSSAADLAVLASALLWEEPGGIVCRETLKGFAARKGDGVRFAAGWEMPARWAVWSEMFTPAAFGHTGFTGTSFWIDPEQDLFVILLTNRVNPTATNDGHLELRRSVHEIVGRAHSDDESAVRAEDWRVVDRWLGRDRCRARMGTEALRALGPALWEGFARSAGVASTEPEGGER